MIARLTSGGGGGQVINEASGSDGIAQRFLSNPVILGVGAIVGYMVIWD